MKPFTFISLFVLIAMIGCNTENQSQVKSFDLEDVKSISVEHLIKEIPLNFLVRFGDFLLTDDYLVFIDFASINEKAIHMFDKNTFEYTTSTGVTGRGPGEITRLGGSTLSTCKTFLWVDDFGREVRWKFPIDSILNNKNFLPTIHIEMDSKMLLTDYEFLNDSMALGVAVVPLNQNSMEMTIARSNILSGQTVRYGYEYPDTKTRYHTYSTFKADKKNERYIRCYINRDLMSICNYNGDLLFNIYGPLISALSDDYKTYEYFKGVDMYNDLILTSYLGDKSVILEEGQDYQLVYPSKLLVFNDEGDLVKVIDVGHPFSSFCIDEVNDRVILYFDGRENPLGYFSLNGILN